MQAVGIDGLHLHLPHKLLRQAAVAVVHKRTFPPVEPVKLRVIGGTVLLKILPYRVGVQELTGIIGVHGGADTVAVLTFQQAIEIERRVEGAFFLFRLFRYIFCSSVMR